MIRVSAFAAFVLLAATGCKEPSSHEGTALAQSPDATQTPTKQAPSHSSSAVVPAVTPSSALLHPDQAHATAPATFAIRFVTTKGDILVDVHRDWSPRGADRIFNLVQMGYFTNVAFFRVIAGFMAQVGIHGDPAVNQAWHGANIQDDPSGVQSNTQGMVSFATGGPNTRTTQFFINFGNNARLDGMGFSPFGRVQDMTVVNHLYAGYGEGAPRGRGPDQGRMQQEGNRYLQAEFPELDYIRSATIQ